MFTFMSLLHMCVCTVCRSYSCICLNSRSPEAWVGELPLPLPDSPITYQQAIAGKAAAWKERRAFLQTSAAAHTNQ